MKKAVIVDYYYESIQQERQFIEAEGALLEDYHCKTEDEVIAVAADADVVIVQFAPMTRRVIEHLRKCKMIVRYAIGVDNIDLAAATERGIYVVNVPDYSIDEVSNHAIALLMSLARKITEMNAAVHQGVWNHIAFKPLYRLEGSTLGLIGLGRIPSLVAKKMGNFGLRILAYDPFVSKEYADSLGVELVSLEALAAESDHISIHCPLNDSTRHLVDEKFLHAMKPTAILVNTARGAVVSEEALVKALQEGTISGAAVDVTETEPLQEGHPLLALNNVIITPHVAWYSEQAVLSLQRKVAEETVRVLRGERPLHVVNQI